MNYHIKSLLHRLAALLDKSALLLIIPALIALYFVDQPMLTTLVQWLSFSPVLAGVAVLVSRIVFHRINLSKLIDQTEQGNVAASILASAVLMFVAILVVALVIWSKA